MTAFVALNTQKKPLDNDKVREALNLAFDRATYLKVVFDNTATAANNPYPPNTWSYAKDVAPYAYDPAKAKQLLAQAGFPNGFDDDLDAPDRQRAEPEPEGRRGAVAGRLAKIGVKAEVKVIEWGELIKQAKLGQHDMLFMGWAGDNGDRASFARFCDTQLDKLIADGKSTADQASSARSCEAAQKIIHDQAVDSARLSDRGRAHAHERERLSRESVRAAELHDRRRAVRPRAWRASDGASGRRLRPRAALLHCAPIPHTGRQPK